MESRTSIAKHVGGKLDYKCELSKIRDMIKSQINHVEEQKSKSENSDIVDFGKKGEMPQESEKEIEREILKGEVELQKEIEGESSKVTKELEVNQKEEEECEEDEALVKTNNSHPILAISILQVTEDYHTTQRLSFS